MSDIVVRRGRGSGDAAVRRLAAEVLVAPDVGDVVFVAEIAGHPAGYAAVHAEGSLLVVDRVMVAPADRGRRVGHRLLDWLEGYGVSCGLERVRITVESDNRAARAFYGRRGYATRGDAMERDLPHL
ncbi:MAG TPA: GNAT family N-acetyltransferase [Gaiellales bacterium]